VRALDARLLADASNPFIAAGGGVTRFPGFSALEPSRINIVSSAKEPTKQPGLGVCRRGLIDERRFGKHRLGLYTPLVRNVHWGSALLIHRAPAPSGRCPRAFLDLEITSL